MDTNKKAKVNSKGILPYELHLKEKARQNRKNPTRAESRIWYEILSGRKLQGYKFLRQKQVKSFILDFYCSELLLAIEIDGDSHAEREYYDKIRTSLLKEYGVGIIRYINDDVLNNLSGVYDDLVEQVKLRRDELSKELTP